MNTAPKFLFILAAVAALSLAYPASVQAVPTTYRYTGNHFTDVSGPYTTSMFVTAMVTLAGPLEANMPFTKVTPIAFTLFDGVQTLSSSTPGLDFQQFFFATNARGDITAWQNFVGDLNSPHGSTWIQTTNFLGQGNDSANMPPRWGAFNVGRPGEWTLGHATPDTESTLSLMMLTLMALGLVARRFQRAAG